MHGRVRHFLFQLRRAEIRTWSLVVGARVATCFFAVAAIVIFVRAVLDWRQDGTSVETAAVMGSLEKTVPDLRETLAAAERIFGERARAPIAQAPVPSPPEGPARIELELAGLIYSPSVGRSRAILRIGDGPQRLYRAGEDLNGGLRLAAIEPDRVRVNDGSLTREIFLLGTARMSSAPQIAALPATSAVKRKSVGSAAASQTRVVSAASGNSVRARMQAMRAAVGFSTAELDLRPVAPPRSHRAVDPIRDMRSR